MKTDKEGKWGVIVIKFGWDKGWVGHECTNERMVYCHECENFILERRMHELGDLIFKYGEGNIS